MSDHNMSTSISLVFFTLASYVFHSYSFPRQSRYEQGVSRLGWDGIDYGYWGHHRREEFYEIRLPKGTQNLFMKFKRSLHGPARSDLVPKIGTLLGAVQ